MPKLSKTRIINLNYNDGKRTIYNEVFDYGNGKDTLFSMDNGIGKTVLIQFFMQPFIRNKRELQGRKFDDYFSGNAPTYIMHEVLLDNGENLLVGMLIKKDSTDDGRNKLKILAFTNRYAQANSFDIINAPFVEDKRILNFSESEERIKKYQSGKLNFKYYNFNDSSKKTAYFEDLKSYKLDYKEWEDIIRNINNDESGLSNLYDKHKTSEALLKNVIVPLIESKLNGEKNIIASIRSNVSKYIESYKRSKDSFFEIKLLKEFTGDLAPVNQLLQEGVLLEQQREALEQKLANIALLYQKVLAAKVAEKLHHEELREYLQSELTEVAYEEHSLNYYKLHDQEERQLQKLKDMKEEFHKQEEKKQELVKEKYIQECAEAYGELCLIEADLTEIRERIANYEKDDSEIARNIKNYQFSLKHQYGLELEKLRKIEGAFLKKQADEESELKEIAAAIKRNDLQQKEAIRLEESYKNSINNFAKLEASFQQKYPDFVVIRNILLAEYDETELHSYRLSIAESMKSTSQLEEKLNKEAAFLQRTRTLLAESEQEKSNLLTELKIELASQEKDLQVFQQETEKIAVILRIKNLPPDPVAQRGKLLQRLESENRQLQNDLTKQNDQLREVQDTMHRYETGLIQLPEDVLQCFANKGIEFQYALNWLQNYQGSREEKESIVNHNLFFPYGIILSEKDIDLLKNESIDVFTSIPIPIINLNELNNQPDTDQHNGVLTIQNQDFLIAFNYLLIDEEERAALLTKLAYEKSRLVSVIEDIQNAINRNQEYEKTVLDYPYHGDEGHDMAAKISSLIQNIAEITVQLAEQSEEIKSSIQRSEAINSELRNNEQQQFLLREKERQFDKFISEHRELKKNNQALLDVQHHLKNLNKEEIKLSEAKAALEDSLKGLVLEIHDIELALKSCLADLELYKNVDSGMLLAEDKDALEAKLKACEEKLNKDIKRDKDEARKLNDNLINTNKRLKKKANEGNILPADYVGVNYYELVLTDLENSISKLETQMKLLNGQIHNLDTAVKIMANDKQHELKDIQKLGFAVPIAREKIKDPNFKARENKISEDLQQNEIIIGEYLEQISSLSFLKYKLEPFTDYVQQTDDFAFDFSHIPAAIKSINANLSSADAVRKQISQVEENLTRMINRIYENYRDKDRFLKDRLSDYQSKTSKIRNHNEIESLLEVVGRKINTLEMALKHIHEEEEVVIDEILRYANNVLVELKTIDKKSSIKHAGKTQKLLEISIPEDREEESLKEYIKDKVSYYANLEEDYTNLLDHDIQSTELLSKLVGNITRIRIDIKKIERARLVRKSWSEALTQNSGGERFVSMFILLSSLMSYMRRRATDIDNREEKKILIMDNPFAKTHTEHLLEPMFQIAEKYNIQLICFSGIGGSAIYNRFNKIYVAKVIEDRFRNKEHVSFKAGNEETLELSDFTITKQQLSMF
ncbi:MAG TPA: hypothetical protein VFC74_00105 [Oscillospiraceae bacterium]|nr:hypothetical protein [Oscillospiraceae bacterium]